MWYEGSTPEAELGLQGVELRLHIGRQPPIAPEARQRAPRLDAPLLERLLYASQFVWIWAVSFETKKGILSANTQFLGHGT